ncbi:PilN domain-containing protein [Halomonas huangheensis]|uniref:Fimbrial assembly protein n=1 Tax=Halomonas huangheensis TaxID=1178482 RepID=W1N2R8_9GAMM|nr:PilN domain-containing protein [Halomonas huangheensis]ALM51399.1 hypothetical protein AR456_03140 [Halomonas huangheensis]ERL49847.1 hypothetical protein BJB45_01620 [Halomonas huangheensis]
MNHVSINLMPWREAEDRRRARCFWVQVALCAGLAFLLAGGVAAFFRHEVGIAQQRQRHIEAAIEALEPQLNQLRRLRQQVTAREARLMEWRQELQTRRLRVELFNELAASIEPGVRYQVATVRGQSVELRGDSVDSAALDRQLQRLELSDIFERAELTGVVARGGRQHFTLSMSLTMSGD